MRYVISECKGHGAYAHQDYPGNCPPGKSTWASATISVWPTYLIPLLMSIVMLQTPLYRAIVYISLISMMLHIHPTLTKIFTQFICVFVFHTWKHWSVWGTIHKGLYCFTISCHPFLGHFRPPCSLLPLPCPVIMSSFSKPIPLMITLFLYRMISKMFVIPNNVQPLSTVFLWILRHLTW